MTEYISVPIETDETVLVQDAIDFIQAFNPKWQPSDGNLDVRILMAIARLAADSRDIATDVPTTIFRYFGTSLLGLPSLNGSPAQLAVTFTARDNAGYTIPDGTVLQGTDSGGNTTFWQTVGAAVIAPGNTSIAGVEAISQLSGTVYNSLVFSAGQLTLVDSLAFISSVAAVGASTSGVDAETDEDYLKRLTTELQLLSGTPIIPSDFAAVALNFAGVARAVAIDGYDVPTNSFNNARTIAVYVLEADGSTPPTPTLTSIIAYLQSKREVNFVIYVQGPARVTVTTSYTAKAKAGVDHTALKAAIDAQLASFLSPANWGNTTDGVTTSWENRQYVRLSQLFATIQDVPGVDYVPTVLINGSSTDLDLTNGGANGPVVVPTWSGASTGTIT